MKLMIAGSREIDSIDISKYIPKNTTIILSGGAKGVDLLAENYADKHNLSKIILRPQYSLYGKAAPLKRNEELVAISDKILVFWNGVSKGTKHTINYAKKLNKDLEIVIIQKIPAKKSLQE